MNDLKKIILCEQQRLLRDGIKNMLEKHPDLKVVAEADDPKGLSTLIKDGLKADILITDLKEPLELGLRVIEAAKETLTNCRIIVLSSLDNHIAVKGAFHAGASAYILKSASPDELLFAIRRTDDAGIYICSVITASLLNTLSYDMLGSFKAIPDLKLSDRDRKVLKLIADGMTNQEISLKLFTSKRTVEGYRQSLLSRTGTRNTAALVKFALQKQLI